MPFLCVIFHFVFLKLLLKNELQRISGESDQEILCICLFKFVAKYDNVHNRCVVKCWALNGLSKRYECRKDMTKSSPSPGAVGLFWHQPTLPKTVQLEERYCCRVNIALLLHIWLFVFYLLYVPVINMHTHCSALSPGVSSTAFLHKPTWSLYLASRIKSGSKFRLLCSHVQHLQRKSEL